MLDKSRVQRTPEWHEMRRQSIGSSDAATCLNISPFKTQYQLYCEKLGLTEDSPPTYAMQRGIDLEPEAIALYEEVTGEQFFPAVIFHPKYPFIVCSLDGMNLEGTAAVEVKCPGKKTHSMMLRGEVPDHYMAQLQHQMACTKLKTIDLYSYDGSVGVRLTVKRDEEYIKKLLEAELAFWALVKSRTPPPTTKKDVKIKDEDPEWFKAADALRKVEDKIKALQEEKSELQDKILQLSDGQNCKGCGVTVFSTLRQGTVDYSSIEELKNIDVDRYRKPSKLVWTVRVS